MSLFRRRAAQEERDFLAWAAETAIPIPSFGDSADPELLAPLDPLVTGRRVAYVGEANHFVHEKYAYRLLFIRYLHARGFRVLAEELAWTDGRWIDRYLRGGDEAHLDRVAAFGYDGASRADRDDAPRGILGQLLARQPEAELAAEQRRFAAALRELSSDARADARLHFYGFDVDYVPSAGYEILAPIFEAGSSAEPSSEVDAGDEPAGAAGALEELRRQAARVPSETRTQEAERLLKAANALDQRRAVIGAALGAERTRDLRRSLRTTGMSHLYADLVHDVADYPALSPAMALRERLMSEHVEEILERSNEDAGLVLLSHNLHLAREDGTIRGPEGTVGPGGGVLPSVGCAIARERPDEVVSVWMLEDHGRDSSPLPGWDGRIRSQRGTLNALLAKVGPPVFALPTTSTDPRASLLAREIEWVSHNGGRFRCIVRDQADVLFFVREVGPLRRD